MNNLNKELTHFSRVIVCGEAVSPEINTVYPNYLSDTAIEVYRNNYRGNLHDALAGAYPVIVRLVGDEFFRFLSNNYISSNQSTSANIHCYGAGMASFLSNFEPVQGLPYLPDMAALEWACHVAYYAEDREPLSLECLAQIPAERYPDLILHTACQIISSNFPVATIWQAHQSCMDGDFQIDLVFSRSISLVSRLDCVVQVSELSVSDAEWLWHIQNGEPLGVATTKTLECYPDFALQATLLNLFACNALTGFNLEVKNEINIAPGAPLLPRFSLAGISGSRA